MRTFLVDAVEKGARILVDTRADRITAEGGRATGVDATWTDPLTGRSVRVRINAEDVVVACGALETPALLLRSGLGGDAVGRHLHLHPTLAMFGLYPDDLRAWWGAPQALVVDEFAAVHDGYGFLVEGAQFGTAIAAAYIPWKTGTQHKEMLSELARAGTFIAVCRDRGEGRVTLDAAGEAVVAYPFDDEVDRATWRKAVEVLARMHEAAGALEVHAVAGSIGPWRRGEDLGSWIAAVQTVPPLAGHQPVGSAHQMGTARMGTDPSSSVADPSGRLHDVAGVWIGDTSAFPSASGANPMLTSMALAHRTAEAIAGTRAGDRPAVAPATTIA